MTTQAKTSPSNAATGTPKAGDGPAPTSSRAADAVHDTVDRIAGKAAKAEERIRGAAASGEGQLREKQAEVRESAEQAIDHARRYVKDNPLKAAGIAFATGLIVSRILGR